MKETDLSVAIIGMKPNQANEIRSAFGGRCDLTFIDQNTSPSKVRTTAASSDYVLLMRKFIPHDVQDAVRHHEGLTFVNGGVTSMKAKLDELLNSNSPLPPL